MSYKVSDRLFAGELYARPFPRKEWRQRVNEAFAGMEKWRYENRQ